METLYIFDSHCFVERVYIHGIVIMLNELTISIQHHQDELLLKKLNLSVEWLTFLPQQLNYHYIEIHQHCIFVG